jgi:hypothetical protein
VDPDPDPLLLRKSGSAGDRTRNSGSVARDSDHLTTGPQRRQWKTVDVNWVEMMLNPTSGGLCELQILVPNC